MWCLKAFTSVDQAGAGLRVVCLSVRHSSFCSRLAGQHGECATAANEGQGIKGIGLPYLPALAYFLKTTYQRAFLH